MPLHSPQEAEMVPRQPSRNHVPGVPRRRTQQLPTMLIWHQLTHLRSSAVVSRAQFRVIMEVSSISVPDFCGPVVADFVSADSIQVHCTWYLFPAHNSVPVKQASAATCSRHGGAFGSVPLSRWCHSMLHVMQHQNPAVLAVPSSTRSSERSKIRPA